MYVCVCVCSRGLLVGTYNSRIRGKRRIISLPLHDLNAHVSLFQAGVFLINIIHLKNNAPLHTKATIRFELFVGFGLWSLQWSITRTWTSRDLNSTNCTAAAADENTSTTRPVGLRVAVVALMITIIILKKKTFLRACSCASDNSLLCKASAQKWRRIYYVIILIKIIFFCTLGIRIVRCSTRVSVRLYTIAVHT